MNASVTDPGSPESRKAELDFAGRYSVPYRLYGSRGPLLVCINGIMQSMSVWQPVIRLMQKTHRVLVFDFPGQGRARFLGGERHVLLEEQVDIVDALLTEIGEKAPVHVLSASFGAVIACLFAQRRPEKVSKLLLGSFSIQPGEVLRRLQARLVELIDAGDTESVAELMLGSGGGKLPERLAGAIRRQFAAIDPGQLAVFRAHLDWLLDFDPERDSPFRFSRIAAETLVLVGENDPILNRDDLDRVSASVADCRVRYLPGAGHFLHLEEGRADLALHYRDFLVSDAPRQRRAPARPGVLRPRFDIA